MSVHLKPRDGSGGTILDYILVDEWSPPEGTPLDIPPIVLPMLVDAIVNQMRTDMREWERRVMDGLIS